ncbi:hypothetical protein SNEBB_011183 [Seison nebaliae]|nr:hypothetical protein SNEBB_011183 [Seison nebaliae]
MVRRNSILSIPIISSMTDFDSLLSNVYPNDWLNQEHYERRTEWMKSNWKLSYLLVLLYLGVIVIGKNLMKNREAINCRSILIIWNCLLATFSLCGAISGTIEMYSILTKFGFNDSICASDYLYGPNGVWAWLFCLSKLPELFDTLFIILKKQKLIFLHWYHHATVLMYCWYAYQDASGNGRWFITMNYIIHTIMYTYYGLRAAKFRIPKFVNIFITSIQILQMFIGCFVAYHILKLKNQNVPCRSSMDNVYYSFLLYFSYFILFSKFFLDTYIFPQKKMTQTKTKIN